MSEKKNTPPKISPRAEEINKILAELPPPPISVTPTILIRQETPIEIGKRKIGSRYSRLLINTL